MEKIKPYKRFAIDVRDLYGGVVIYGPYRRKQDNRAIIVLFKEGKIVTTKLYAKIKLEIKLGRILSKLEEVDHIDEDLTNDKFKNLQLLSGDDNRIKAVYAIHDLPKEFKCAKLNCFNVFYRSKSQRNYRMGKLAFCSGKCRSQHYGNQHQQKARVAQQAEATNLKFVK